MFWDDYAIDNQTVLKYITGILGQNKVDLFFGFFIYLPSHVLCPPFLCTEAALYFKISNHWLCNITLP